MPKETIAVFYKPVLLGGAPTGKYHKFIIYTDMNGDEFVARAGPARGDGYEERTNSPDGSASATDYLGDIVTETGPYVPGSPDYPGPGDERPGEIIAEEDNLYAEWLDIVAAMQGIHDSNANYNLRGPNSNSAVDAALAAVNSGQYPNGLPPAQRGDEFDSPGSGMPVGGTTPPPRDEGGYMDDAVEKFKASKERSSPLVFDLDHSNSIELISLDNSTTYWDGNIDGFTNISGWATGGDGFLALDKNHNGNIDDNSELFGTADTDGFTILASYDSNQDNLITEEDAVWDDLLIWLDTNEDGVSNTGELYTLADHDIISINLNATEVSETNEGHDVTHTSTFTVDTGAGTENYAVHDIWFQYNTVSTAYIESYEIQEGAVYLPNLRGYGLLPDLTISISLDYTEPGSLAELVIDFSNKAINEIFSENSIDDVRAIMYRWADVESIDPDGRGAYVDGQELAFLEKLMGQPFLQKGRSSNPYGPEAGYDLQEAFHDVLNNIYARLVIQSSGDALFEGNWHYETANDSIIGVTGLDTDILDELETTATGLASTGARLTFWENVVRMIEFTIGTDNLSGGDLAALQGAITGSDATLDLEDDILPTFEFARPMGVSETGTSGNDTMTGSSSHDTLNGGNGNDILDGGAGGDYLKGGNQNDTYIYESGDGFDTILDISGTSDIISFAAGIDAGDLTITRQGQDDLVIAIDDGVNVGQIVIEGQFTTDGVIESINFASTSPVILTGLNWSYTGDDTNETIHGVRWGGGNVDTMYGMGGNDKIYGYAGADTLYGGDGNDHIEGGDDNDTVYGDAGNDTLEGGAGNDHLYDGTGDDRVLGGTGDDTYHYGGGHDVYEESSGTDVIILPSGIASASTIYYRIGNDMKIVFDANNSITIKSYYSASGPKIETLDFYSDTDVTLSGVSAILQDDDTGNTIYGTTNIDYLYGNGGNDTFHANDGNDFIYGGTGDDTLNGGNGNDYMDGGAGDDRMVGGSDNDTYIYASGHDSIYDTVGTEELRFVAGWTPGHLSFARNFGALNDLLITINAANSVLIENQFTGNDQVETIRFADNSTIDLMNQQVITYGNSSNNSISGITVGGSVNDIIYGYDGNDTLSGGDGADMLYGGNGTDTLNGNDGDDLLDGGAGSDTLSGHAGNDTYVYTEGLDTIADTGGTDTLRMGSSIDVNAITFSNVSTYHTKITVTASTDEVTVNNLRHGTAANHVDFIEFADGFRTSLPDYASWVNGTSGNDLIAYTSADETILGKGGNDTITAGGGADDVHGGSGNDTISGEGGNDLLHGGDGNDTLYGGDGLDTLFGGAGEDVFVFEAASAFNNIDVIKDFDIANDAIDLSDVLSSYDPMTDLITDWVEMTTSGSDTILKVDRDGTGGTYSLAQIATIQGVTGLTNEEALVSGGQLLVA